MIKRIFISLLFFLIFAGASSHADYMRVFLKDKGPGEFTPGSEKYIRARAVLSSRCLERRAKSLSEDMLIDERDIPVYPRYLDTLNFEGGKVRSVSRWLNYAVVDCDSLTALRLAEYSFVDTIVPVADKSFFGIKSNPGIPEPPAAEKLIMNTLQESDSSVYGYSYRQNSRSGTRSLHSAGTFGSGVIIGIADAGFLYKTLPNVFPEIKVHEEYDFVALDSSTATDEEDLMPVSFHGVSVLSVIAAEIKDSLYGNAPNSSFYLARTEDLSGESRIEEDNLVAALEWFESKGTDIISMSIGYRVLRDEEPYSAEDLDGVSTLAARAANIAREKGVLTIAAAGNDGPSGATIGTPADGRKVLAVGAVDPGGNIAGFSSRGPTGADDVKPDLASFGAGIITYSESMERVFPNAGTSFSTPLVAGMAALLLSASPELSADSLYDRLIRSGSCYDSPNDSLGYGEPDIASIFASSDLTAGDLLSVIEKDNMICFCRIKGNENIEDINLNIQFDKEEEFRQFSMQYYDSAPALNNYFVKTKIPLSEFSENVAKAYITFRHGSDNIRRPFYSNAFYDLHPVPKRIPVGFDKSYLPKNAILSGIEGKPGISVYPTVIPADNPEINISGSISPATKIKIFDVLGNEIEYKRTAVGRIKINISENAFLLVFIESNGNISTHKIIVGAVR